MWILTYQQIRSCPTFLYSKTGDTNRKCAGKQDWRKPIVQLLCSYAAIFYKSFPDMLGCSRPVVCLSRQMTAALSTRVPGGCRTIVMVEPEMNQLCLQILGSTGCQGRNKAEGGMGRVQRGNNEEKDRKHISAWLQIQRKWWVTKLLCNPASPPATTPHPLRPCTEIQPYRFMPPPPPLHLPFNAVTQEDLFKKKIQEKR